MEGVTRQDVEAPAGDTGADEPTGVAAGGVVLRLGGSRYVLAMADVAEVVQVPKVTRIPGAPSWLRGVANWRGRMLPVIDVRPLLGAPSGPLASSARLVVVQGGADGATTAGLVAETVQGVFDVVADDLAPAPPTLAADAARLVAGQVSDHRGPLAVLDAGALLGLRNQVDRRRHGS